MVLAQLLDRYLGPQQSVLAETLARQIGEQSPILRKLSPTDSEGLVQVLQGKLNEVMKGTQIEFLRALDPLAENGAVARFLKSLREELESADQDRNKQLSTAFAALDANNENSLLSRLVRETRHASNTLLQAVNPETPGSPMAVIKQTLSALLTDQNRTQQRAMEEQRQRQVTFEKEVREALARLETRRSEDQKNPRGGLQFEDAVGDFVIGALRGSPILVEKTGKRPGRGTRKIGDLVASFTDESAFTGAKVVFEAKRDASYNTAKAIAEIEMARENREACVGVFVMAQSHAPAEFPRFARYGSNILVTWDENDGAADPYLHAAVFCGLALVARKKDGRENGDLKAIQDIEHKIAEELSRLQKMEKSNDSIRKNSDSIGEEIRKAQDKLQTLLVNARTALRALELDVDEQAEKESPIRLPSDSLRNAVVALSRLPAAKNGSDEVEEISSEDILPLVSAK